MSEKMSTLDYTCDNCGKEFKLDLSKAGKDQVIKCPNCNAEYHFSDDDLKKLGDQLDKFDGDININIG